MEYHYGGIYDSTDLGRPLTGGVGTTVTWKGASHVDSSRTSTDSEFTITFTATGGDIDAFVVNVGVVDDLLVKGKFDAGGVITGKVHLDGFANSVKTDIADGDHNGVLSGLIGVEGMVAVFVSGTTTDGGVTITGGTFSARGFVGGFVAGPNVRDITESLANVREFQWDDSFSGSVRDHKAATSFNQFLQYSDDEIFLEGSNIYTTTDTSNDTKVTSTNLNMRDATFNNIPLGGDADDVVAFGSGFHGSSSTRSSAGRSFYAGIRAFFDLGKELQTWQSGQPASADWHGQFLAEHGDGTKTNTDFTLEVNFENRQVEAFVPVAPASTTHYHLKGSFPTNDDGAIRGTVDRRDFTNSNRLQGTGINVPGVFTGLIGQEGAVGVFISGTPSNNSTTLTGGRGNTGYVGGFIACHLHADGRCRSADR